MAQLQPATIIPGNSISYIEDFEDYLDELCPHILEKKVWNDENITIVFNNQNYLNNEYRFNFYHSGGWDFENLIIVLCDKYIDLLENEGYPFSNYGLGDIYIFPNGIVEFETLV